MPKIPKRQIRRDVRPALAKYAALVGEVTYASNAMHATFFLLFQMLFDMRQSDSVGAIWHSLRSDDLQRNVLKAAVEKSHKLRNRPKNAFIWAINKAGKLAEYRNAAIHTAFEYGPDGKGGFVIEPSDWAVEPRRLEKLLRLGHENLFKLLIGDFTALEEYISHTSEAILGTDDPEPSEHVPLCRRPLLRSIRLEQQRPPPTRTRRRRSRQRRPPQ